MKKILLFLILSLALFSFKVEAQSAFVTANGGNGSNSVAGVVPMCLNSSGKAYPCTVFSGSTGLDYSANQPTLPNIGANFGTSGPYANYVLIATVPASSTRANVDIENTSGAQIAIVRDDGTAAANAAPVHASVFSLAGGIASGSQGGSWSSTTFKGRIEIYAASSTAIVAVMVD